MTDTQELWIVIAALGFGSYGMRYLFLGLARHHPLPDWLMRHLRYTAVSILPALVTPLVVWPDSTGGQIDPVRVVAALAALVTGYVTKNVFWGMGAGASLFLGLPLLF